MKHLSTTEPQGKSRYYGGVIVLFTLTLALVFIAGGATAGLTDFSEKMLSKVKKKYGRSAVKRLKKWQELVNESRGLSEMDKLEAVNDFFNENVKFLDDIDHWKKKDYWATPVETLVTRGGDCEDFSIAKYFTLKELGVPDDKMLITYVKALDLDQAHMVLTYYTKPTSIPLVLDNLIDDIRPANKRKDLKPVYSFNGEGLWLAKERGRGKKAGSSSRLSLWKDMGSRMERELSN